MNAPLTKRARIVVAALGSREFLARASKAERSEVRTFVITADEVRRGMDRVEKFKVT